MPYHTLFDSLDKVLKYLRAVSTVEINWKGTTYPVANLHVNPSVFRDYKCPAGCGACCRPFTMDWIPDEQRPDNEFIQPRQIEVNGTYYTFYSDTQQDRRGELACRYLRLTDGRCTIHDKHTLSCDFPMITVKELNGEFYITGQLFGRLGLMRRPTGGKGGMCTIHQATPEAIDDVVRKLRRLETWCNYLNLPNRVQDIISWARGPMNDMSIEFDTQPGLIFDLMPNDGMKTTEKIT